MGDSVEILLKKIIKSQEDILKNQVEIIRFIRFIAHREFSPLVEKHLTKDIERRVYELTDGIRSSRDIETEIDKKVTQRTVVSWWQNWQKLGLLEPSPKYIGRMQKIVSLSDIGIPLETENQKGENK